MYNIVNDETLASLRGNLPQKIRIAVDTANESFEITQSNIAQGSCSVERYCCSGEKLEIGSAIAAELKLTLKNAVIEYNGQEYDPEDITFEGAEMRPFCLVPSVDGSYEEIPLGVFTVDEQPRKLSTITIAALDRMMRFDVAHDGAVGTSLLVVVQHCCTLASVTLSASAVSFLNSFAGVYTLPGSLSTEDGLTCRQVLMWVGEMTASCAYVNEYGELDFKQYPKSYTGVMSISEADRYSSDMQERDITITGITVTPSDSESEAVTIGEQGYEWNIEGNPLLITPDEMASAPLGYSDNCFFSYRPFKANTKSFPHLWPLDAIVFYKRNSAGESIPYNSVITQHTWKLNGASSIVSVGKTATKNGYATYGGFTAKQKAILERVAKNQVSRQISGYQQAVLDINRQAQKALGLFSTTDDDTGITYYHNQPNIEDSTYIYMESTAGRYMATGDNAWNNGDPVWTNAWTSMGQIVAHSMAAGSITTDMLTVGASSIHNLFLNGDFSVLSEWSIKNPLGENSFESVSVQNAAVFDIDSIPAGDKAARILRGSITASLPRIICNTKIPVIAGETYTASFYMMKAYMFDTRKAEMCIDWLDSSGGYLSSSYVESTVVTEWTRFSNTVTAPSNASYAQIMFYLHDSSSSDDNQKYVYVAGFMLESGSTLHDWDNGSKPSSGNVLLTESGIDIYNGAFNLHAPNGQNVIHFDADESLNINTTSAFAVNWVEDDVDYSFGGTAELLVRSQTANISLNSSGFASAIANYKQIDLFKDILPGLFLKIYDPTNPDVQLPTTTTIVNPIGIYIQDESESGNYTEITSDYVYAKGNVYAQGVKVTSVESAKTNIAEAESMLDKICSAGIYSYNYISDIQSSSERSGDIVENGEGVELEPAATHYGLVIGDGYNTPEEVISADGAHINLYSMIALAWKAIQELADKLNTYTAEVTENAD